ncbi:response regulator [Pirellulales bacterium]|nr:response regulator [Pirellulales bacterium]
MAVATYFVQGCPTCGRNLQVRVQYLGKRVVCQHCGAKFRAADSETPIAGEGGTSILDRADQLLMEASAISGIGIDQPPTTSRC